MNLLSVIAQGGWLMIPIILCSVIALAIIVKKFIDLNQFKTNTNHFMFEIKSLVKDEKYDEAVNICSGTKGAIPIVLKEGIKRARSNKDTIESAMETGGTEQVHLMERNMGILATISGIAPLIGFLGTVTGMIQAFMEIERLGGNVNATVLAGGIWEALLTTAAGLSVGIPTFIFYNYITSKIGRQAFEIESSSMELLELILETRKTPTSE
jgi:biopolymer transport protein ExbB